MKSIHYTYILVLVASIFFVEYDLSRRADLRLAVKSNDKVIAPSSSTQALANPQNINTQPETEIFARRFKEESLQIAKIQNNQELVQSKMKELAKAMNPQDIEGLYEIISDEKNNGDQRALAVELLSIKNDTTSLIALQNFVANDVNVNGAKWDRKKELETILRAQAVESIAAYPQKDIALSTLSYLQRKVDEKFLNDRIGRAAANLYDNTPTSTQQDDASVEKLVE